MAGGVGGAFTVSVNCSEFEPPALAAVTVNVKTPAAEGFPLIRPLEDAKKSPGGRAPPVTLQMIGAVPIAASVCA
jgi:hypothetical protein